MRLGIWLPILMLLISACAPLSQVRPPEELMTVPVGPEDDFDELARRYLGDPSRKWIIEDYNRIDAVSEGQLILIPRGNYRPGGIRPEGYQMVPVLAYPDLAMVKSEQIAKIVDNFESQLQYLKAEGYHVIDIHQLSEFLDFKSTLPPKSVALTFDDQSRLFYDLVFPILQKYEMPATLFIDPQKVGAPSLVDWDQLREMSESGIEIQYRLPTELARSLKQSPFPEHSRLVQIMTRLGTDRERIAMNIGRPCRFLAYPESESTALVIILAEKAGFSGGFNTIGGSNPFYRHRFAVHRDRVGWDETLDGYRNRLVVFKEEDLR